MSEIVLDGCLAEPMGRYLAGLGVLRVVAEQLDPTVTGRWDGDRLVLSTSGEVTLDGLVEFMLDDYRPTPVVSPWNGSSGFHPKDKQDGIAAVEGSPANALPATARRSRRPGAWSPTPLEEVG